MTNRAAFDFCRRVLEHERPLLVGVAFHASGVCAGVKPRLFQLKSAMRIVTVAALHRAFKHAVMKRLSELRLRLVVAGHTKLRLVLHKHLRRCQVVRMRREWAYGHQRGRRIGLSLRRAGKFGREPGREVRGVAVRARYVVAPVFASLVVVVLFLTGVTLQTAFGDLFRRFVFESPNLCLLSSAFNVRLAVAVTRLTALPLRLAAGFRQLGVSRSRKTVELAFVTGLASLAADIIFRRVLCGCRRRSLLVIACRRRL